MATTNPQHQNIAKLHMIQDQEQMIRSLWENIQLEQNIKNNRFRKNVIWRYAFTMAVTETTALSYKIIGSIIEKDHSTVVHTRRSHEINLTDGLYKQIYYRLLDEMTELVKEYQKGIHEVIKNRKKDYGGEATINSMVDMYERRISSLERKHMNQIADYQKEIAILEKELKLVTNRANFLNKEALRLKNLL